MKKLFSLALLALLMVNSACVGNEQIVSYEQLPQNAQNIVKQYFADDPISFIMKEKDGLNIEYEVRFASGSKLEFDKNGEFKSVDCVTNRVPDGLVPEQIRNYVTTQFANQYIVEYGKDGLRWKAELNSGLELLFDSKYNFVGVDD